MGIVRQITKNIFVGVGSPDPLVYIQNLFDGVLVDKP